MLKETYELIIPKSSFFQWESECLGYGSPLQGHREGVMLDPEQNHRVLAAYPILSLHQADNCPHSVSYRTET